MPAVAGKLAYRSAMALRRGRPAASCAATRTAMPRTSWPPPISQSARHHNGSAGRVKSQITRAPASSPASTSTLRASSDASTLARPSTVRSRGPAAPGA